MARALSERSVARLRWLADAAESHEHPATLCLLVESGMFYPCVHNDSGHVVPRIGRPYDCCCCLLETFVVCIESLDTVSNRFRAVGFNNDSIDSVPHLFGQTSDVCGDNRTTSSVYGGDKP